jgi:hypothetical protein
MSTHNYSPVASSLDTRNDRVLRPSCVWEGFGSNALLSRLQYYILNLTKKPLRSLGTGFGFGKTRVKGRVVL